MGEKKTKNTFLHVLAVILLSLTAAMTLLGGAGTTCVAFAAENFGERMAPLIPVKPIFQILVVVSLAAAVFGIITAFRLGKGRAGAYRNSLIFLVVGLAASAVQFYFSLTLRGSTAPNNMRMYLTAFTLLFFLALRIPGIWEKVRLDRSAGSGATALGGGMALFLCGLLTLTTPLWGATTHIIDGYNTVYELYYPLIIAGSLMMFAGTALVAGWRLSARRLAAPAKA